MDVRHSSVTADTGDVEDVVKLQRDLARKFHKVGTLVIDIWRNFTPEQPEIAIRESIGNDVVLEHCQAPSLSNPLHLISDCNLDDMTSDAGHFVDMLTFRATADLSEQVRLSDGPHTKSMIGNRGLRLPYCDPGSNEIMLLLSGERYGQLLNHLVEEVLDLGSNTRTEQTSAKVRDTAATVATATSTMRLQPSPEHISFSDLLAQCLEQKQSLEDHLAILRIEPLLLNSCVTNMYYTRPELVPDKDDYIIPAFTDEFISMALFDVVINAVHAIAAWDYIFRLLTMLDQLDDNFKRPFILDELGNVCHSEYKRAQKALKRQMSAPMSFTHKRFRRTGTGADFSAPKINIKGRPTVGTVSDSQVYYILQLCHSDTTPLQAVAWIQNVDNHNARCATDRTRLMEHEMTALGDLAVVVSFIKAMSSTIHLEPRGKKAQRFVSLSAKLIDELSQIRLQADFGDHVIPMGNILEPGAATAALQALDDFVVEKTGEKLGLLFHDLPEESIADLEESCRRAKIRDASMNKTTYVPLPSSSHSSKSDVRAPAESKKAKTRGTPRVYDIAAPPEEPPALEVPPPKLQVRASTAALFSTLFSSDAKGAVAWKDLEAALADLGFSVTPRGGSEYSFNPPESLRSRGSITIHRPHKNGRSDIEGYRLFGLKYRLKTRYGWDKDTFEIA